MTETETTKASNGAEAKNGQGDDVSKQIIRQVKSRSILIISICFQKYNNFLRLNTILEITIFLVISLCKNS